MKEFSDKNQLYKTALHRLNNEPREKIEEKFVTIDTLMEEQLVEVQTLITDAYRNQDRFKVYHVTKVHNPDYKKLDKALEKSSFRFDFLISPDFSDWSIKGRKIKDGCYEFSFSKFSLKYIKNEDEQTAVNQPLIPWPYYFQFMAEFKVEGSINTAVLSFPAYRPNPYGTYEFETEIGYFYAWVLNYGLELHKIDYKEIFDALDEKQFDKFGFKGEDLQTENDLVKSIFQLKHTKRGEHSQAMHTAIDRLVGPEMVDMIMFGLNDSLDNAKLPEKADKNFRTFLDGIEFSRKFFSSIQKGCEHGVGFAKYSPKGKPLFEYNFEYTKTGQGLIRSKSEKWSAFEPVYNEIVRYLKKS